MLEIIRSFEKFQKENTTIFQFPNNRNVVGAKLTLAEEYTVFSGLEVEVKYAINGVITDPISLGKAKIGSGLTLEINAEIPTCASHIYIIAPNGEIEFSEILIIEELSEEVINYYPAYFDTDLGENYFLNEISVFTTEDGFSHYSVYTSLDGRDFDLVAKKCDSNPCDFKTGDVYSLDGREARIIRVYIEYNTSSVEAIFDRIEFKGKKSGSEIKTRPEIDIPKFEDSEYNVEITENDTFDAVYGIIERRIGALYKDWFKFEIKENPKGNGFDYFKLSNSDNKILVTANSGVSLAVGVNHYLKYYCKVNICQVGDQAKMPADIILLDKEIFKETKAKVRYSYNYCTLSYSMAFWGENEWQEELDWLALNGVNVVLDATAQEEVWRRFLTDIGYTHEEILKFITGPAYYAWAYMANMSGFGGPVHDSWFYERTALARKNHLKMRALGMYPVLQGYSGMLPNNITEHFEDIDVIMQGTWCSFDRPIMLRTTSPIFREFANKFYKAQSEVYGNYSMYYATDPFHEGGNTSDMLPREISREVLSAMLDFDKDAVWIIQSWQTNPTSELLAGLDLVENGKQHALILDLYAEKMPNYKNGHSENPAHGYSREFDKTPWVFCMLNNFGGRLGLHGHLDNLANWIPEAYNNCDYIAGIGITPEASFNNPVLYDFLFESVWRDSFDGEIKPINLNEWICDYAERRYGGKSDNANKAWEILLNTVYKAELNNLGQGAPESVVNSRPTLEVNRPASSWGNAVISYDKNELIKVAKLLLLDYDKFGDGLGYRYDLVTVLQQILSNTAQDVHFDMAEAFNNKNSEEFKKCSGEFLKIADLMDKVTAQSKYYLLGRWVEQAKALAKNADDFTKMLYELNAKSLITTWGSFKQCESGGLRDYSNRQWSGLIGDFYKVRWARWINDRVNELEGNPFEEKINWFEWEWLWARSDKEYPNAERCDNLLELSKEIF